MAPEENNATGKRLRQRRKAFRLTLKQVADEVGITESYLSQIENGKVSASIQTLQKIVEVLRMTLGDLFANEPDAENPLSRFNPDAGMSFGTGGRKIRVSPKTFTQLEVLLGILDPGGTAGECYTHGDSDETVTVMEGSVTVTVDGVDYVLNAYDSINYRSSQLHTVKETTGEERAIILWSLAPPTY